MTRTFAIAAAFAAISAAPALAQGEEVYKAETPSLNSCIEAAGSDGEATQAELDACIKTNMAELTAALPDVAGGATVEKRVPAQKAAPAEDEEDQSAEE